MKKTLIVMSVYGDMEQLTRDCLRVLTRAGAAFLNERGCSDVAMARCRALTYSCQRLREMPDRDVLLMLDADIEVSLEAAQAVTDAARRTGQACSAIYGNLGGRICAARWKDGLWLAGLGCLAIPVKLLFEVEQQSQTFELLGDVFTAFTWSTPEEGHWVSEDFRLSMRLGGVRLLPVAVGHVKKIPIWPDDETIAKIEAESGEDK